MVRAAFVPLCLLMFTILKVTISCLDDHYARHAILGAVVARSAIILKVSVRPLQESLL